MWKDYYTKGPVTEWSTRWKTDEDTDWIWKRVPMKCRLSIVDVVGVIPHYNNVED